MYLNFSFYHTSAILALEIKVYDVVGFERGREGERERDQVIKELLNYES